MFKTRDVRPGSWKPDRTGNTLGDLVRKRLTLLVVCHRCKHQGLLFPANLVARFGENYPAVAIRRHVRCSVCRCTSASLHEASR